MPVEVVALLVSPVHAYEGRPADGPRPDPAPVLRECVEVRAGLGLVGDRYFAHPAHRRAAVTLFAAESLDLVAAELGGPSAADRAASGLVRGAVTAGGTAAGAVGGDLVAGVVAARRNIVLRGADVDTLAAGRGTAGAEFSLDTGDGPVRFQAHRPASPCRWMDEVLAPGAWKALRGRGGVRCEPLSDGTLRLGPATLRVITAPAPSDMSRPA